MTVRGSALTGLDPTEFDNSQPIAFVNVNVVPMDADTVLARKTVLVEDGLVSGLGDPGQVAFPPNTKIIQEKGSYLAPALADMHVHPSGKIEDQCLLIASGVTKIRCMWGSPGILSLRDRINAGDAVGPTIYTTGPGQAGRPLWPGTVVPETAEDAKAIVREHVESGYDYIKVYSYLARDPYLGVVEEEARLGIPVVGHVSPQVGHALAIESRQASIEHGLGGSVKRDNFTPSMPWIDPDKLQHMTRVTAHAGIHHCLTFSASLSRKRDTSDYQYLSPAFRAWLTSSPMAQPPDRDEEARLARRKVVALALYNEGVNILLGSDAGISEKVPGPTIVGELLTHVEAGLTPFEAIQTGTVNAAKFLRRKNFTGTIRVGEEADLVLLRNNPLESVEHFSKPLGVMVRGHWLPRDQIDRTLSRLADRYRGWRHRLEYRVRSWMFRL